MTDPMTEPTPEMKARIDAMSQAEMASKWRFAPVGDPMFQPPNGEYFAARFKSLGGMTPELSKRLGWDQ